MSFLRRAIHNRKNGGWPDRFFTCTQQRREKCTFYLISCSNGNGVANDCHRIMLYVIADRERSAGRRLTLALCEPSSQSNWAFFLPEQWQRTTRSNVKTKSEHTHTRAQIMRKKTLLHIRISALLWSFRSVSAPQNISKSTRGNIFLLNWNKLSAIAAALPAPAPSRPKANNRRQPAKKTNDNENGNNRKSFWLKMVLINYYNALVEYSYLVTCDYFSALFRRALSENDSTRLLVHYSFASEREFLYLAARRSAAICGARRCRWAIGKVTRGVCSQSRRDWWCYRGRHRRQRAKVLQIASKVMEIRVKCNLVTDNVTLGGNNHNVCLVEHYSWQISTWSAQPRFLLLASFLIFLCARIFRFQTENSRIKAPRIRVQGLAYIHLIFRAVLAALFAAGSARRCKCCAALMSSRSNITVLLQIATNIPHIINVNGRH